MTVQASENLSDVVFHYAETRPDSPALVEGGTTLSYRALAALVEQGAAWLSRLGIVPGDRVAVAMTNSIDHIVLVFALFRVGAVLVEVPPVSTPAYKADLVRLFDVRHVLADPDSVDLPAGLPMTRISHGWRRTIAALPAGRRGEGGDAPAIVRLSSGSTGMPRGRLMSHDELLRLYRSESGFVAMGLISPERPCPMLIALSISFAGLFGASLTAILAGGSIVLLPKFAVLGDMVRAVASWEDAVLPTTSDMSQSLIAGATEGEMLLPNLRALVSMGQPLFAAAKRALVERVTPNLYDTYGAAGIGLVAYLGPEDMIAKGATVGRPIAGVEVEIVDAAGRPKPPGEVGRLRVRRPGQVPVFEGDQGRDGGRDPADEWVWPADLASLDADGYLVIKGRAADLVVRRGAEIFPPEVEEALLSHPAVREAAVVGLPRLGAESEILAFVIKSAPVEHDELVQHCVDKLPAGMLPDRIYYTAALPRLGTGKVDRAQLRSLAQSGGGR